MSDEIFDLIKLEKKRQSETLMMIPSENYTYPEVREAVGSILMHKYAEGVPGRRYYQGNEYVDTIESLCESRALEAFELSPDEWSANVQPHSGCEANIAVYNALIPVGEKILSMHLPDGGHLSHGYHIGENKITLVSKVWDVEFYHVDKERQVFDYTEIALLASKIKPKLIISGGTAYPREIDHERLGKIAHRVGALYMADIAHEAGLIVAGAMKSPFPYADVVTFTTHKTLRGPRGAAIITRKENEVLINKSIIPGLQGGPHLHTIAGIAIALEKSKSKEFKKYGAQVIENAKYLAKLLESKGFDIVSGGTDKHLVLIDLRNKKTNGWFVAWALETAGIIANRNTVPNDTGSTYYPSGLRIGTPAITVRGMKEKEMESIASWIEQVVEKVGETVLPEDKEAKNEMLKGFKQNIKKDEDLLEIATKVRELCDKFPLDF